jgi:hypothetical protein
VRRAEAITRYCPTCGAAPGDPCVYLPVARDDEWVSSKTRLARIALTGTPTRIPHGKRGWPEELRLREWLRANGAILWTPKEHDA